MADRPRIALARAYALLGELVAGPLDEGLVERAGKSPLLGEALGDSPSLDELAADHHRAFEWCAFPHQGVYLDPNGWADGTSAQQLRALYVGMGYEVPSDLPADHLSALLGALARALIHDHVDEEGQLLDEHLLRWLPLFCSAVERVRLAFPAALVGQLEELVLHHRELMDSRGGPLRFGFSPAESILDEEDTTLAEIARFLLSPPRSGIFLSREDILRLVRSVGCFAGFGDRQTMLLNGLRTAVQYERLPEFTAELAALHSAWEQRLEERVLGGLPRDLAWPWLSRSQHTRAVLQVLGAAGRSFSTSVGSTSSPSIQAIETPS